ncbi:MAG: GIY-YIG nuclease family protein [Verrucomicrobia bacterium]|nr:GIY-YIG nuclease family protein [Verrucomicrobiota bacterium]MCH8528526.1 GIY-YIG nuclease family protein [Kiritimatiellia bacterium]
MAKKKITDEDIDLLNELEVDTAPSAKDSVSSREQRILAGFEEIVSFAREQGRVPQHGEDNDIFERIYAVRLDRIRALEECRELLKDKDVLGLLSENHGGGSLVKEVPQEDVAILEALGVEEAPGGDIAKLAYVRSREEIQSAEEVAQRLPCKDFDRFQPVFKTVQIELDRGTRETVKYQDNAEVKVGDLFVLDGQKVLVAAMGAPAISTYGRPNPRLRVIYDNGTESDLLLRSLQRALNKDKASRRITETGFGPLFSGTGSEEDQQSGVIYVLRSLSEHSFIQQNREVIHKIGVTGGSVEKRIANAEKDPTFLLAPVEVVGTFRLANLNRSKLENLLHKVLAPARLDMELQDRFGFDVNPREWFLVPFPVIEEAVERIIDGSIGDFRYDPTAAKLLRSKE